jgi:hypothetical protein
MYDRDVESRVLVAGGAPHRRCVWTVQRHGLRRGRSIWMETCINQLFNKRRFLSLYARDADIE